MDGISFVHRHLNALQKMMELTLDDWDTATRKMLAIIADVLDVKYVGFCRNYNNDCDELNWVIYTRDEDSYSDMTMQVSELKKYTSYLSEELLLAVDDVFNDERVREYNKIYHIPYGITSSMEIPMRVNGKVSGIMCMEHVGPPRKWTEGEQSFALLAERIMAISVESDERAKAEAALVSSREKYMRVFNGLAYRFFGVKDIHIDHPHHGEWIFFTAYVF